MSFIKAATILMVLSLLHVTPLFVSSSQAVQPDEVLKDEALEARARKLSLELRCLVCQNQSIDDSDAPLAKDLRVLVRERLVAGDTDQQVIDFLVTRYGEFVLLKPRLGWHTLILWGAPLILLALSGLMVWRLFANRGTYSEQSVSELSAEEAERIKKLLQER